MDISDNQIPEGIGGYKLSGPIQEKTYSTLVTAWGKTTCEKYTCKIISRSLINNYLKMRQLEDSIRIRQQMRHPNIIQLTDLLKDEDNFYIMMEHYDNGSLFDYINCLHYVPEQKAKTIFLEILKIVQFVHSLGVAHRDICPENFILDQNGQIKLCGFDVSVFSSKVQKWSIDPHTFGPYSSPECISNLDTDPKYSDIWSIGIVLYALLIGHTPWKSQNYEHLLKEISIAKYNIPDSISKDASDLIQKLTAKNPEDRITLENAMKHPWLKGAKEYPRMPIPAGISISRVDAFFSYCNCPTKEANIRLPTQEMCQTSTNFTFNKTSKQISLKKVRTDDFTQSDDALPRLSVLKKKSHALIKNAKTIQIARKNKICRNMVRKI